MYIKQDKVQIKLLAKPMPELKCYTHIRSLHLQAIKLMIFEEKGQIPAWNFNARFEHQRLTKQRQDTVAEIHRLHQGTIHTISPMDVNSFALNMQTYICLDDDTRTILEVKNHWLKYLIYKI